MLLRRLSRAAAASASYAPSRLLRPPHTPSAALTAVVWTRSFGSDGEDDDGTSHYTGSVKFYMRNKAYGFIKADDASLPDVFVHVSDIDSEQHRRAAAGEPGVKIDPYNPFLHRGERVRFEIKEEGGGEEGGKGGRTRAWAVTYEDGTEVPKFRKMSQVDFLQNRAQQRIGGAVFRMMETEGEDNAEHVGRRCVELYQREMREIQEAKEEAASVEEWAAAEESGEAGEGGSVSEEEEESYSGLYNGDAGGRPSSP